MNVLWGRNQPPHPLWHELCWGFDYSKEKKIHRVRRGTPRPLFWAPGTISTTDLVIKLGKSDARFFSGRTLNLWGWLWGYKYLFLFFFFMHVNITRVRSPSSLFVDWFLSVSGQRSVCQVSIQMVTFSCPSTAWLNSPLRSVIPLKLETSRIWSKVSACLTAFPRLVNSAQAIFQIFLILCSSFI